MATVQGGTSGPRWLVFSVTAGLIAFMQLDLLTIGAIVPDVARDLRADAAQIGVLVAAFAIMFAALQVPAGLLFSRGHQKTTLAIAAAMVAAGNLLFAIADSFAGAVVGRFLSGAAGAFFFLGFTSLMSRLFAPLEFGRVVGANQMIKFSVATLALLGLPSLLPAIGWRGYLWAIAGLFVVMALAVWKWVPNLEGSGTRPAEPVARQLRRVVAEPNVWWSALAAGFGNGCLTAFLGAWVEPFLLAAGFSGRGAAWLGAAAVIGLGMGIFAFGWVSDRLQRRKLPLVVSGFSGGLVFAGILLWPQQPILTLGCLLFLGSALASAPLVLPFTLAKESVPASISSVGISVANLVAYLVMAACQILPGLWLGSDLSQAPLDRYQWALSIVPASLLITGFVALLLRETAGRQA